MKVLQFNSVVVTRRRDSALDGIAEDLSGVPPIIGYLVQACVYEDDGVTLSFELCYEVNTIDQATEAVKRLMSGSTLICYTSEQ